MAPAYGGFYNDRLWQVVHRRHGQSTLWIVAFVASGVILFALGFALSWVISVPHDGVGNRGFVRSVIEICRHREARHTCAGYSLIAYAAIRFAISFYMAGVWVFLQSIHAILIRLHQFVKKSSIAYEDVVGNSYKKESPWLPLGILVASVLVFPFLAWLLIESRSRLNWLIMCAIFLLAYWEAIGFIVCGQLEVLRVNFHAAEGRLLKFLENSKISPLFNCKVCDGVVVEGNKRRFWLEWELVRKFRRQFSALSPSKKLYFKALFTFLFTYAGFGISNTSVAQASKAAAAATFLPMLVLTLSIFPRSHFSRRRGLVDSRTPPRAAEFWSGLLCEIGMFIILLMGVLLFWKTIDSVIPWLINLINHISPLDVRDSTSMFTFILGSAWVLAYLVVLKFSGAPQGGYARVLRTVGPTLISFLIGAFTFPWGVLVVVAILQLIYDNVMSRDMGDGSVSGLR